MLYRFGGNNLQKDDARLGLSVVLIVIGFLVFGFEVIAILLDTAGF